MDSLEGICSEFLKGRILSAEPFGDGHINDTYRVMTEDGDFVCQHVRQAMNVAVLEHNYGLYSEACDKAGWIYPAWLKTHAGKYFYTDQNEERWRMYPLIRGDVQTPPLARDVLFSCGQGLAKMHKILQTLAASPQAVYPKLHDLERYYEIYENLLCGKDLVEEQRDVLIEGKIREGIREFRKLSLDRTKVVHGDAKLANILFQEGKVKAFLDLDTVMQGSLLEDVADCIRSGCIVDGMLDEAAASELVGGYVSEASGLIDEEEIRLLPQVFRKICFELGLRYYTDAIAKEKVFKEKYPGYLLEKARGYFFLKGATSDFVR